MTAHTEYGADLVLPAQLFAQPLDVQIQRAAVILGIQPPHALIEHFAVQHNAAVAQQYFQQVKFPRGQVQRGAAARYPAGSRVQHHIKGSKSTLGFTTAAQHRFHPCHKLSGLERLGNVIIRAQVQPTHTVRHRSFCGQKNHRGLHAAQVVQQLVPIGARQHNVQQGQIIGVYFNFIGGLGAGGSFVTGVARALQRQANQRTDGRFVIHNQNRFHGRILCRFGFLCFFTF